MENKAEDLEQKIEQFFSDIIRPQIQLDGGDIHLLSMTKRDGGGYTVQVTLAGACVGCGLSSITLQMGVEARLRDQFPEIREIEVVP